MVDSCNPGCPPLSSTLRFILDVYKVISSEPFGSALVMSAGCLLTFVESLMQRAPRKALRYLRDKRFMKIGIPGTSTSCVFSKQTKT